MRNAFRGLCAFAALISLITLPMTAQGEPTRHWLITSHSQLSTNQVENQESDENGIFNISPSQEKRYFDVNRIGLTDGDPVKDNKIPEGERYGGDVGKPWMTANISANLEDKNYLEVDLGDGIDLGDDDLVFYLKRYALDKEEHPTGLRIVAGNNDSEFKAKFDDNGLIESFEDADIVGYAYFQYRGTNKSYSEADKDKAGNGTKEYSARIDLGDYRAKFNTTEADRYTKLRIYFTANNTKKRIKKADGTNSDNRTAKLLSFNIMQLGKDENYSDILVDRFHLVTDYSYKYYYHDFIPTLGIFDPHNQYQTVVGVPNHPGLEFKANVHMKDYTKFPSRADYPDYIGDPNSPWVEFSDSKGSGIKWNKDLEYLKLIDFEMPEYRWVENVNDNRISKNKVVTNKGKKPTDVKNRRQPVHVVEHELYAIPGDPIALYPFYELANDYRVDSDNTPNRYALKFAHWYNYRTGGNVTDETGKIDYLDFLVDPSLICKSKDFGYYGGMAISRYTKYDSNPGSVAPVDPDYVESTIKDDDTGTEIITYTKETKDGETITATDKKYIVKINSAAGLAKFASDFNSGVYSTNGTNTVSELTVQLGAVGTPEEGLDFTNIPVTAIGNDSNPFSGKFEGRWVALKNYNVEGAEYGIFGKLGENAVINRLYAENKGADGSKQYVKIDTTDGKRTTDTKTESSTVDIDLVQIKSVGSDGTEKESSKMIIKTVEGLIDFQQRFNKGEISSTVNVELLSGKVYNFDGKTFEPIGTKDYPFAGAFNGKGATISNLVIDDGSMPEVGMFGYVKGGATVKSFCLDASCKFIGEHNVAPIAHLTKNDINDAVVISNIITYAEVYRKTWSTDYVGGIFGYQDNTAVTVRDCVVAGTVKADNNNGAFIGYTSGNASIGNTIAIGIYDIMWSDFLFAGGDNIVYENCYEYAVKGDNIKNISSDSKISTDNKNGINLFEKKDGELYFGDIKVNSDEFAAMLGEDWQVVDGVLSPLKNAADETGSSSSAIEFEIPKPIIDQEKKPDPVEPVEPPVEEPEKRIDYDDVENLAKISDTVYNGIMAGSDDDPRNYPEADEAYSTANKYAKLYKYGAVATFLCPRSTKSDAKGEMENLPEDATAEGNDKDYIIAADFASLFEHVAHPNLNIDNENEALYEPQITFRHLFRIKDGKKFAEDFSGSPSKNEEYVTKHRRVITARSNSKKFQIRLDCPVPRQIEGVIPPPSKYYYHPNIIIRSLILTTDVSEVRELRFIFSMIMEI